MPALKKVAFLDRDGVINVRRDNPYYVTSVNHLIFNEGIFEVLRRLVDEGFELVILTNQRAISLGLMSESDLLAIHNYMVAELQKKGVEILEILFCPHGLDECSCRKPKHGMLHAIAEKYVIDFPNSILISDSREDVEMGEKFGIGKNIYVEENNPTQFFDYYKK